ncbi:MAG: hypothetical protein LBM27_06345 [Lactobacillaceae bacterium]|nr:hypothetical protein [Lactobacillaceae bacterium]
MTNETDSHIATQNDQLLSWSRTQRNVLIIGDVGFWVLMIWILLATFNPLNPNAGDGPGTIVFALAGIMLFWFLSLGIKQLKLAGIQFRKILSWLNGLTIYIIFAAISFILQFFVFKGENKFLNDFAPFAYLWAQPALIAVFVINLILISRYKQAKITLIKKGK